ncbi:RNA-directed DNA polymerase from mobile element jockey [Merluccius polli]|uniref:RNA-directed DNA polymerase from mobile element jockey n=1 Tax=Merluccius polli TaxID=89951 RepID=A0AA47N4D3_MERPO|nr:RNA-directed DNA polymerase from mobile element jockey [Merluccius polli]
MWQGIQEITNFRGQNNMAPHPHNPNRNHPPSSHTLTVQAQDVKRELRKVNPRKTTGPDGVPGKILRACADQLAQVFTTIFNLSLAQASIPACLKSATIISVPKKTPTSNLNDYCPISLTPTITKCLEQLFAYRANRSTEDAIAIALHTALSHLEHRESYIRMLFIDFSSAFNTIIPDILVSKLSDLGLPPLICSWIKDFLTNQAQTVKLGPHLSSTQTLNTGSPQGCVLSPLLYNLYTSDCRPAHSSNTIVKFADDTTVVGLISGGDESAYREEIVQLSVWFAVNNLALNTTKTKEIILDFRKHKTDPSPLTINGDLVERVRTFTFTIVRKGKQYEILCDRIRLLQKLKEVEAY